MKAPKDHSAQDARNDEQARQAKIRTGTDKINSTYGQFEDKFYDGRNQAFLDYATPQLSQQYDDAQKKLTYSLDRAGTLDSSIRAQKEGELKRLYDQNRQQVADQGLSYQTTAKNNVEASRADLVKTLNATGDAEGAANSALTRAQVLTQPDQYSPLGQLFTTFLSGLGQDYRGEQAYTASNGAYGSTGTGLFGANKNAVQVNG